MKYFKQSQSHTCGVACFRMVLSDQGLPDMDEDTLSELMGTTYESGTHYDSMVKSADVFGLKCLYGEGTLSKLDELTKDGWTVVVAYSVDVPHYSLYMKQDSGQVFLCDPFFGEKVCYPVGKFMKKWKVDVSMYKLAVAEMGLILDKSLDTYHWYVAYKK